MAGTKGPHSYRDFIDPTKQMYLSDQDILEIFTENSHLSPYEIAENRYRENVIRLQLRDLKRIDIVREKAHDTYEMTEYGHSVYRNEHTLPCQGGLFDIESISPKSRPKAEWSMTDFSKLDGETIKKLNFENIEDSSQEYGWVEESPSLTRQRVSNVPDTDLHRTIREFPTHDPLPQQCAHWMRALAGMHWFPDANHRTGMNSLSIPYELLTGDSLPISLEIERTVLESKLSRHLLTHISFNTLWKRDSLYCVWHRYFRRLLCGDGTRTHEPPKHHLRLVLNYAREVL